MGVYIKGLVLTIVYILSYNLIDSLIVFCTYNLLGAEYLMIAAPISNIIILTILIFVCKWFFKTGNEFMGLASISMNELLVLTIIAVCTIIVQDPIFNLFEILGENSLPEIGELESSLEIRYQLGNFISAVLLIPVVEELFFRGIVLSSLLNKKKSFYLGVLFSSMLFSLIHFNPWDIQSSIPIVLSNLLLGIILGGIFVFKRNIFQVIFLHVIFNLFAFILKINYPNYIAILKSLDFGLIYWLFFLVSLLILLITLYLFIMPISKKK